MPTDPERTGPAAAEYARLGLRVVILHGINPRTGRCTCGRSDCGKSGGKHPRWHDWTHQATADPDRVAAAFEERPCSNVGVALGSASGVVAVDIDGPAGEEQLAAMSGGELPPTWEMRTGNGRRLLYRVPDGLAFDPRTASLKSPDGGEAVRVQGTGGQCVMPPSCHYSGAAYAWEPGRSPAEGECAGMPVWLIQEMMPRPADVPRANPGAADVHGPGSDFNARGDWWADVLGPAGFQPWRDAQADGRPVTYATRPGKGGGVSASLGYCRDKAGRPALWVWSGSVPGLQLERSYDLFGAFAFLFHGGDFSKAAGALVAKGFGRAPRQAPADFVRPEPVPRPAIARPEPAAPAEWTLQVSRASEVVRERIDWLWHSRVPLGMVCVLDGDPGLGKSTICADVASRVTTGEPFPHTVDPRREPADVVFLCAEDSYAQTVRPRLEAAGADLARCHLVGDFVRGDEERPFSLPFDLPALADLVRERGVKLVVVDAFLNYLTEAVDSHKDQSIRTVMRPLKVFAERAGCAVVLLRHLKKGREGVSAIHAGGASIGITASARVALMVARDPDDEDSCLLAVTKTNAGKLPDMIRYGIAEVTLDPLPGDKDQTPVDASRIEWGELVDRKADSLFAQKQAPGRPPREGNAAEDFLYRELAAGPVKAAVLFKRASAEGVSEKTLRRAKDKLGVYAFQPPGADRGWVWSRSKFREAEGSGHLTPGPEETQRFEGAQAPPEFWPSGSDGQNSGEGDPGSGAAKTRGFQHAGGSDGQNPTPPHANGRLFSGDDRGLPD